MNELIENIDKLHTTEMGAERIKMGKYGNLCWRCIKIELCLMPPGRSMSHPEAAEIRD